MTPRFPCRVSEDGSLVPTHPERTQRFRGREVWVSLHERPAFQRGQQGNKYLWAVVYGIIAAETGNDPMTVHQALKREAVRVGVLEPSYALLGDKLFEDEPTTVVDSEAFWNYVTWVRHGCEHGDLIGMRVHIPEPNEG